MNADEFIGLTDELNDETLKKYQELGERESDGENQGQQETPDKENSRKCPLVPRIVNVVGCVDYDTILDLNKIATHIRNAEYNPKRFPAVTIRIQNPKATGLAFQCGKLNIVGCINEDDTRLAARKFGRIFKQLGFPVTFKKFFIANIVATMDCKFPIHLESLASDARQKFSCTYNPEVFAGLIYKVQRPPCKFLLFVSGKIIVTGTKTIEDIYAAANYIYPILYQFAQNFQQQDTDTLQ